MKTLQNYLETKTISFEDFGKMTAEKQAEIYNELNKENAEAFAQLSKDVNATKDDVQKAKDSLIENQAMQMKTMNKALEEVGLKLKALEEGAKSSVTSNKSLLEQLKENKETLEAMSKGAKGSFTVKAVGNMLLSGNVTGQVPQAERIEGLNAIASRQVRLLDIVSTGTIGSNLVEWVYQSNKQGAAGSTVEGAAKNQIDFDMLIGSQKVEKVTAYIKATTEMLSDISWIEQEIRNELMRELMKRVEADAYSGDGVSPNLLGYRTVAPSFAAGSFAGAIDNANRVDVLVVADNQIKIANQPRANYILMHPTDVTKLKVEKLSSTDKRYIDRLQMIAGTLMMDGIPIIETTLVTVGEYLIGYFDFARLLTKDGAKVTIGLDSDDFTKNFRTILIEWRGVAFIKNNDRTAFVKGVFATDMAALETV